MLHLFGVVTHPVRDSRFTQLFDVEVKGEWYIESEIRTRFQEIDGMREANQSIDKKEFASDG